MPKAHVLNKYQKVQHRIDADQVAGTYTGYLLKYDWSGQVVVEANKLSVTIEKNNDSLLGSWNEDDSLTIPIHAKLSSNAIVFTEMQYSKTNHYSAFKPEKIVFKQAYLLLDKIGDSIYLSGNIQEYIPHRNEPSKPLYLALVRTKIGSSNNKVAKITPLRAYPNPFGSTVNIDFELKESCNVVTKILTLDGKVVYSNPAGVLAAGSYSLPIQTQQVAAGYYILALHFGNKVTTTKIIKL